MKLDEIVLAESIIEKLKPVAEEVSGLKLAKLEISLSKQNCSYPMSYISPNEIIIYSKHWDYKELLYSPKELSWFELGIAHELGHHVEYTINPNLIEAYGDSKVIKTIIEGFAEYFSLDLLPIRSMTDEFTKHYRRSSIKKDCSYHYWLGYDFFRAITTKLGEKESFFILKNLDVSFKELKNPDLYINRRKKWKSSKKSITLMI